MEVDQLLLMKSAGLTQIDLGIETGSVKSLEKLKKKITIPQIKQKVALAKDYVKVFGFFMIGIPGENETDVYDTFQLAKDLKLDRSTWSIYSPLPGSILYDELVMQGKIDSQKISFEDIHFTKTFEGICDIPAKRLSEIYNEINDFFYKKQQIETAV
ncbi:MAG TPA: radical SAM protein [Chitinophagaceae bacterium]|nr:radical SAM protein [Chitinophagaceae bacterium]